ncbi:MAG: hypothetical protein KAT74_07890 [Candidatus Cloacimonetes bacterium]|nr:hypothetical protein [Candidatus Cloacimonadota bacterium]
MKNNNDLFHKILIEFHSKGVLNNVILIGSWVLPIYRHYFSNTPEIPILRTADVDFLIHNPPKISTKIDIPKSWQKKMDPIIEVNCSDLFEVLKK